MVRLVQQGLQGQQGIGDDQLRQGLRRIRLRHESGRRPLRPRFTEEGMAVPALRPQRDENVARLSETREHEAKLRAEQRSDAA